MQKLGDISIDLSPLVGSNEVIQEATIDNKNEKP